MQLLSLLSLSEFNHTLLIHSEQKKTEQIADKCVHDTSDVKEGAALWCLTYRLLKICLRLTTQH